jgi:hypothetical protein
MTSSITIKGGAGNLQKKLEEFAKVTGKTTEDAIDHLAEIAGKKLISQVQPYGTNAKIGEKLASSIAKQVRRATRHGNVIGQEGSAGSVHAKNRNSKGQIPKGLSTLGKFKRSPIPLEDVSGLVKKKMENAGIAKGAWFAAVNQVSGKKITGVAKWITRHENANLGNCSKSGKNLKRKITLTNSTPYIEKLQTQDEVKKAVKSSYPNFSKYMDREMEKHIQKLNA